jgi:hypothetical protein
LIERRSIHPLIISSLTTTRPDGILATIEGLVAILLLAASVTCHFDSPFTTILITVGVLDTHVTVILPVNMFMVFPGKAIIAPVAYPHKHGSPEQVWL